MEQRFLFPASELERQSAAQADAMTLSSPEAATLEVIPAEQFRQTEIYRLPDHFPLLVAPQPNQLTGKQVFRHVLLALATLITTTLAGFFLFGSLNSGLIYSLTLLAILTAHEMGHYIACRWYGVEATLPYYIPFVLPFPVLQVGTFGAFIKIKSPIPSRRALFDIGIAGPLAGFVFALPATFIAHYYAQASPFVAGDDYISLQDPLLFKFFQQALHLPNDLLLNPVMFASWVGLLMTALNLMPVGQLDGGHVTYSLFGHRGHRTVALLCYVGVVALVVYSIQSGSWSYILYAVILTLMMRVGHPPVLDEEDAIGAARILVALIGLIVFILCFMPFPISL
ncbi:MAG: site-2 protease family protein [Acidobacteriota bacterium]|nr:site-2 protease family protein [Acidobacteriota bacterium]